MSDKLKKPNKVKIIEATPPWGAAILFLEPLGCPRCGSTNFRRLVYGYPSEPLSVEEQEYYELGGCVEREEHWWCKGCDLEW